MRALTIRQPWASLVASGVKRAELRSRPTHHRGRFLVHAARAGAGDDDLPRGAIVAVATLVNCVPVGELGTRERRALERLHPIPAGWYAWRLTDVVQVAVPVPARGRLSWWHPDGDVLRDLGFPAALAAGQD